MNLKRSLILLGVLFVSVLHAAEEKDAWWNSHWEYRVPLTVENKSNIDFINRPVIITGEQFIKKTGLKDIKTTSFRLILDGKELPVQVDEKDDTVLYNKEPNYKLDRNDEIIFQATIPAGKKLTYHIYVSKKLTPAGEYSGDIKTVPYSNINSPTMGHLRMSNSVIDCVVKGPAVEAKGSDKLMGEYGCGAITDLKIKGTDMLHFYASLGQSLPGVEENKKYTNPETLISGPVRIVVKTELESHTRYFILYSDVDIIEVRDNFKYEVEWDPKFTVLAYSNRYAAGIFDKNDELLIPLGGKTVTVKMAEVNDRTGQPVFYNTAAPEANWFAWFDQDKKIGMATFLPKDSEINQILIMQVIPLEKAFGRADANPCNSINLKVPQTAISQKNWTTGVTYVGINSPEQANAYYDFMTIPGLKFGFVEEGK